MKFLPYEHFKIRTLLTKQEVLKRLDSVVEPKRSFHFFGSREKPYQGKIAGPHFEVSRIINYGNSFLPMIKGDVESEIIGSSVLISMQPHIFVIVFMPLWVGGMGVFFLVTLISLLSSSLQVNITNPSLLRPLEAMFVFCVAALVAFKFEAIKSKKFFEELFEAAEVEEMGFANPF